MTTRERIVTAARGEFAELGLAGARIDRIALLAGANKQMIYHYFGSKDGLFTQALEAEYARFRNAEAALDLDPLDPVGALDELLAFTWTYYLDNPGFIRLVNSANLHRARHLQGSETFRHVNRPFRSRMRAILEKGIALGMFRAGIDPVQLQITIAALGYYYLTNQFTGSLVFERDLGSQRALADRLAFNRMTILRLVCTPRALAKLEQVRSAA